MKPMKGQMALFDERTPAKSRREGAAAKHAAPSRRLRADWRAARDFAADMVAETLYPTRCAVCDKPGAVLCGSCAAAAAKAAAWMLLSGSKKESIRLLTPKGMELALAVENIHLSPDCVRCAIRKDSGDDPDITRDTLIYAEVRKTETVGIVIDGGRGVGRVLSLIHI